jgi:molecular chaperone DnaK (HSP70)
MNTLVIDLGTHRTVVALVGQAGNAWLIPDPINGERYWSSCVHWDGRHVTVGASAERRAAADPDGLATGLTRGLSLDLPMLLGSRRARPSELLAELLAAIRTQGQAGYGPTERALLTVPGEYTVDDPRRGRLVAAAEQAGFGAVELLPEAVAAINSAAPTAPFRPGETVLVFDSGATFTATLVRIGADRPEILGHQSLVDATALGQAGFGPTTPTVEQTLACCRDLLTRLAVDPRTIGWVLPVGSQSRTLGLNGAIERALGISVRLVEDPELAVLRGAVQWLQESGPRVIAGQAIAERIVPLSFTIPGGSARMLRWFVSPDQAYREGATLARVRLTSGAIWDLTARSRGTLDRVLVADGAPVRSGEWLGLSRA